MSKPSIPQGTRDFSPEVVRKRQYILNTLKAIFEKYGFQPLETPSMENLSTLTGKYGEEGDRLIFRILNSGNPYSAEFFDGVFKAMSNYNDAVQRDFASKGLDVPGPFDMPVYKLNAKIMEPFVKRLLEDNELRSKYLPGLKNEVGDKALRYDLTIPFARYVAMNQNDIAFPFRRYQMQPVWRGDRPQRGRYREFWQCDADVVGSTSLINEAELIGIYNNAFKNLGIDTIIQVNNRKILVGIAEVCGIANKFVDFTIALDKLDKIGWEGVENELLTRGIDKSSTAKIKEMLTPSFISISKANKERLTFLRGYMENNSEIGMEGINELEKTLEYCDKIGIDTSNINFEVSLARGLSYYTGFIVEVVAKGVKMGSIGGGGRYDDLTGLFGLKGMSGVGVSFGIDRIYDVLEELNAFPEELAVSTQVMFVNFGGDNETAALHALQLIRNAGISAEIFPDAVKFDKQMKYANKRNISYVILTGDEEREKGMYSLKNFKTGEQQMLSLEDCIKHIQAS